MANKKSRTVKDLDFLFAKTIIFCPEDGDRRECLLVY